LIYHSQDAKTTTTLESRGHEIHAPTLIRSLGSRQWNPCLAHSLATLGRADLQALLAI
jgi:hypothetical protein